MGVEIKTSGWLNPNVISLEFERWIMVSGGDAAPWEGIHQGFGGGLNGSALGAGCDGPMGHRSHTGSQESWGFLTRQSATFVKFIGAFPINLPRLLISMPLAIRGPAKRLPRAPKTFCG